MPCSNGNCGAPVYEPDGTACVLTDSSANTVPGFCQAGTCSTAATSAFYNSQLSSAKVKVSSRIRKGSASSYVNTALKFWDEMAFKSKSCTFNNGGCGTSVCLLNKKRTDTTCVNPSGMTVTEWVAACHAVRGYQTAQMHVLSCFSFLQSTAECTSEIFWAWSGEYGAMTVDSFRFLVTLKMPENVSSRL